MAVSRTSAAMASVRPTRLPLPQPPRRQCRLAEQGHAISLAHRRRLPTDVEGAVDRSRGQQREGQLLLLAEGGDGLVLLQPAARPLELAQQGPPHITPFGKSGGG